MRRIVCAAIQDSQGTVVLGARHYDMLMHAAINNAEAAGCWSPPLTQGFIDQRREFLTRQEAWPIALSAGQIIRRVGGDEGCLYSENLY